MTTAHPDSRWRPLIRELPVLLSVFLFFTGDHMMLYTAFPYTTYAVCIDTFSNATASHCRELHTQPDQEDVVTGPAALLFMTEKMVGPIPSLVLAAILGPWSDLHGRRLPMVITCMGACLATILFLLADWLRGVSVVAIVMTGFIVRAMTGQGFLFRLMSYSHTADWVNRGAWTREGDSRVEAEEHDNLLSSSGRTHASANDTNQTKNGEQARLLPNSERKHASSDITNQKDQVDTAKHRLLMRTMSRLQAAESLGVVVGALAAWGVQVLTNAPISLCLSSAIHVLAALVIVVWMRDAMPASQRHVTERRSALEVCREKLCGMWGADVSVGRASMWGSFLTTLIVMGTVQGRAAVVMATVQRAPLSWPNDRLSAFAGVCSATTSIFLFFVAPFFRDNAIIIIGLITSVVGSVWMVFLTTTWQMMVAGCLSQMADCVLPAVKAIVSKKVDETNVGRVLSRLTAAEALACMIGPLTLVSIYYTTSSVFSGAAFLASAVLTALVLMGGTVWMATHRKEPETPAQHLVVKYKAVNKAARVECGV